MSEVAKKLRDRRLNVWNEARAISEGAADENRALSAEEQGTYEAHMEEMDKLDKRIKEALAAEKRFRDADEAFNSITGRKPAPRGGDDGAQLPNPGTNQELRSWFRGDPGAPKALELRRDPNRGPISYRNLVTTVAASGGSLTPTDFYDQLLAHLIEVSGLLQAGPTILSTAGGESLQIPRTTAHSTGALTAQVGSITETDPAFAVVTLTAFKYATLISVARELLDDSGVDLVSYLGVECGRALGNAFGADLVTGTGTSQPTGLVANSTLGVTGATGVSGLPNYSNLVDLEYSVIAPYRQSRSCYWMAADKTIGGFRKILDSQNRPIWEPSMVLGSPDLLLGKPLVADPYIPATATSAKSVFFGDFAQFFVRLVGPVRFERSDDYQFNTDLVTFRAVIRGDGTLVDRTGACMKYFAGAAT